MPRVNHICITCSLISAIQIVSIQPIPQFENIPQQIAISDIQALTTRSLNISEEENRFGGVTSTNADVFDVTTTIGIDDDNVNNNRRGT